MTTESNSAATQRKRSAKAKAKVRVKLVTQKAKPRGKPFAKGNPYRWVEGQSGNPTGTAGPKLSTLLLQALGQPMPEDKKQALKDLIASGVTIGQIAAWTLALQATEGDLGILGFIGDRTEGSPEQRFSGDLSVMTPEELEAKRKARWDSIVPAVAVALATSDDTDGAAAGDGG